MCYCITVGFLILFLVPLIKWLKRKEIRTVSCANPEAAIVLATSFSQPQHMRSYDQSLPSLLLQEAFNWMVLRSMYVGYVCKDIVLTLNVGRPSHLWIPGGPKMTRATLIRQAINGPCMVDLRRFCVMHIFIIWRYRCIKPVCFLGATYNCNEKHFWKALCCEKHYRNVRIQYSRCIIW